MSYITEIFERANLQKIREFLFYGVECVEISEKTYEERLKEAENIILKEMRNRFPEEDERESVMSNIVFYKNTSQNIYMEIGMECGAVLAMQLLNPKKE